MTLFSIPKTPKSRNAATPSFHLRRPQEKPTTLPKTVREYKEAKPNPMTDLSSKYQALKASYHKLLEENSVLKSSGQLLNEHSLSTVQLPDREFDTFRYSAAHEVEELHEVLSSLQESIGHMLLDLNHTQLELEELRKKHSHLKFTQQLQQATTNIKLSLVKLMQLQETFAKKSEELVTVNKEKRRKERSLFDIEQEKLNAQQELRRVNAQIRSLDSESEAATVADLHGKLVLATQMLALSDEKVKKYESYIQAAKKKSSTK